jgi:hypothetical protein
MKIEFSRQFAKNVQISNFMKIHPVAAELLHAGGRTDMKKLIVVFRSFANAPNKNVLTVKEKRIDLRNKGYDQNANSTPSLSG